jgi:hypothetical protein
MVTVNVQSIGGRNYRPAQLQIELGLGKTQFTRWVKALGLNHAGKRKHFYSTEDRCLLLSFRGLLNEYQSLDLAFEKLKEQAQKQSIED